MSAKLAGAKTLNIFAVIVNSLIIFIFIFGLLSSHP